MNFFSIESPLGSFFEKVTTPWARSAFIVKPPNAVPGVIARAPIGMSRLPFRLM